MSSESSRDILQDMMQHVERLMRAEIRLAKAELREESGQTIRSASMLGVGLALGLYAGWLILNGIVEILEEILPEWMASLLLGVVVGGAAARISQMGAERLREANPVTREAVDIAGESVKSAVRADS